MTKYKWTYSISEKFKKVDFIFERTFVTIITSASEFYKINRSSTCSEVSMSVIFAKSAMNGPANIGVKGTDI